METSQDDLSIRRLTSEDAAVIDRCCRQSPWTLAQYTYHELPRLLATRPAVGAFDKSDGSLRAWLLATTFTPPYAWVGGFGVPWSERTWALSLLDALLPPWYADLGAAGVTTVLYSGTDEGNDWLRPAFLDRGYRLLAHLRGYDKIGTFSPTDGNQLVTIAPIDLTRDLPGVLAIEEAAFAPYWRFDTRTFTEMVAEYPFFIVARTPDGMIAGYQASIFEDDLGFLVRIAVHPRFQGQGIGQRLMAEAMRFFAAHDVARILLNAEEANAPAHRLYEAWGFVLIDQVGFVLEHML